MSQPRLISISVPCFGRPLREGGAFISSSSPYYPKDIMVSEICPGMWPDIAKSSRGVWLVGLISVTALLLPVAGVRCYKRFKVRVSVSIRYTISIS